MNSVVKYTKHYSTLMIGLVATLPYRFRENRVERPATISHIKWENYLLEHFDKEGMRVLEVGSRNVTGSPYGKKFKNAEYVGFDFYDGDQAISPITAPIRVVIAHVVATAELTSRPNARHAGNDRATHANRACLYGKAREENSASWSGSTRNWQPAGPVWLNPETEIIASEIRDAA